MACVALCVTWFQAPSVVSGEASLPGLVDQMQPLFISRFLEGQSGVTIKSVSCGDLFTSCLTGGSVLFALNPTEKLKETDDWVVVS